MTNAPSTITGRSTALRGAIMDVSYGEFGPYGAAPSGAVRSIVLVGRTGDMTAPWGRWHDRYVVSLPPLLRVATPDDERPAHVLRLRYWNSGPLQGSTTAHLVPAALDAATGTYKLQERVAASGHSATFRDPQAVELMRRLTGQALESVNIHDHDLTKENQNNVD